MKKLTLKQEAELNKIAKDFAKKASKEALEYSVSFNDEIYLMDEDEFLHFIKIAVIRNKDIHNFTVTRL